MMKKTWILAVLTLAFDVAHADLAGDLRALRGTVSEMANTSKELSNLTGPNDDSSMSIATNEPVVTASSLNEGDILMSKIANIKLLKEPSKKAERAASLTKSDEMVYTGTQANGFYAVATANKGEGWVEKILVKKR